MTIVTFLVLFSILVLLIILNTNRYYWKKRGIVQEDSNTWHFVLGKCSLSEIYKKIYDSHPDEDCVGTFVGIKPVLILKNLEDVQAVLLSNFSSFYSRGYKTNPEDLVANNLLLIDDYARWKLLRQKISPLFAATKLKKIFDTMERCASDFVKYIKLNQHAEENFFEAIHLYVAASTSASVFGINSQSQNTMVHPIIDVCWKSTDALTAFNIKFALSNISPKLVSLLNLNPFGKNKDLFVGVMKEALVYRSCLKEKKHDFIDVCLELQKKDIMYDPSTGLRLKATDELLTSQAFSFFVAGVDTTSNLINFTLLELSNNPKILKRLYNEIDRVFESCQEKITYEELRKMEYLEMVINESLRKYPPVGLTQRMCMKDTVLPGSNVKIRKNDIVIIPIYAIHRDEKYFSEPEVYDPERFNPKNVSKIVKSSYIPFSEGNRGCIASRFAHLQIKAGLAWLLRSYTLKGYNYTSECFEPSFFGLRDSKARYDLIARKKYA